MGADRPELGTLMGGNVGHRLSTYEKRGTLNGTTIDARGAISTQFVRTPDGGE